MTLDMRVVPFKHWHLMWLEAFPATEGGKGVALDSATLEALEERGSWTGVCDGVPVACAGLMEQWPGRTVAWAYMAEISGPHMLFITRKAREALNKVKGRIELTVRCDFAAGHRWAKMLGFEVETPVMTAYGPEGEAHTGYVRHNKWPL